jgi:3-oxoadipate enol-lactonase
MGAALSLIPSFDGTAIAVRCSGSRNETPVLVVNALGATLATWMPVVGHMRIRPRVVTWDLRGLHDSGPPASDRLDPGAHAEDGIAALDEHDVDRVGVAAWASGARIAAEIAHRYPERVAALALVCPDPGRRLSHVLGRLDVASVLPTIAGAAKHFAVPVGAALRALAGRPELAGLIRQSGMVGATADTSSLVELMKGMAACNPRVLLATYEAVAGDPADDILPSIEAPTLVVAGGRDPFTPPRMARAVAESIPGARVEIYDDATHYLPLEFPARLAADLDELFDPS